MLRSCCPNLVAHYSVQVKFELSQVRPPASPFRAIAPLTICANATAAGQFNDRYRSVMSEFPPWISHVPSVSSAGAGVSPRFNHEHLWAMRRMLSEPDPETPRTERLGQQRGTHLWKPPSSLGVNPVRRTICGRTGDPLHSFADRCADESRPNPTAHL